MISVLLLGLACAKPDPTTELAPGRVIESVLVTPGDLSVTTGAGGGEGVQFSATVTWGDGQVVETTTGVEWTASNETAGTIDETGWFQPVSTGGGVTWVTAALDGVQGQTTVTVVYQDTLVEGDADSSLFDAALGTTEASLWLYPEDGVNLPRNTPGIMFQWAAPNGLVADAWRIRFQSEVTALTVYTTATNWTADEDTWQAITSTNAGGTVSVELAGVFGTAIIEDQPLDITVNRFDAQGTIVYWSSSAAGFMDIPYGQQAEGYLTKEQTGYCVACHAISRNGDVAFTYDGGNGPLGVKDKDGNDLIAYEDGRFGNFKAWSPDATRLLSTYYGDITLWDATNWTVLGSVPIPGGATHPDWSPDGTQVVFTATDSLNSDWSFGSGSIDVISVLDDDQWGSIQTLYTSPEGRNAYYPAFSPDGEWISFNLSTGDGYNDLDAELWVIPSAGGDAIRLSAANRDVDLTNSWTRWGPLPDDEILWLAFSSTRPYGAVTAGNPQIWVTAFDPAQAQEGDDPSYAAFWLPGQDSTQNNHVPVWTE
ncbi:MAG: hypothetical protein GXP62_06095 [Oligoflexia bacterium]|nr:hypothetical protein [Oligoflexia bacterium]